ncbi:hypothetical protein ACH5RR_038536 [Cinchona calisaya]|uniref:Uncharacterized protein n=1 Tax=Cinchona calisaya TaxID=153742 RepID=A0ABD2Y166_9GENT
MTQESDFVKNLEKQNGLQTYIVHVEVPDGTVFSSQSENRESLYSSFLSKITATGLTDEWFCSKFNAAGTVSNAEVGGICICKAPKNVQTTHSPNFLRLQQNFRAWPSSNFGKGVIIGVLDSGITPGHPSFNDEGMPPPPAKWIGKCDGSVCNNKLIGARNFVVTEPGAPIDSDGHGTHTASTAAGNFVKDANVFGNANGTAVGMSPLAHLAIYKVCSSDKCAENDILAGMDAAIQDGVDVLSISLVNNQSIPFFADATACGASTINRVIRATVSLGNNDEFDGQSLFQPKDFPAALLPLVYPGINGDQNAALCAPGSLNNNDVRGKVVLCDRGIIGRIEKGKNVKDAGGAAMILMNQEPDGYTTLADAHVLPAAHISFDAGQKIKAYMNSTSNPTATILFKGTVIGSVDAPTVASFSSRGPSLASPGILKPDIIGPGVIILAAWPFSVENKTNEKATFNIISGTSMSCPHLSGIAALIKSAHPDWSPGAIKSAIMTTADRSSLTNSHPILNEQLQRADIFNMGAGHVNPLKATDPGLIYDLQPDDYIPYLCGLGYSDQDIASIIQRRVNCSTINSIPEAQLNYPSFSIHLGSTNLTYTRTVTNVGEANSSYSFAVILIPGVKVSVTPLKLNFSEVNQKLTYQITFARFPPTSNNATFVEGAIAWISEKHFVRSPIAVKLL